jgi:hypothetical protein
MQAFRKPVTDHGVYSTLAYYIARGSAEIKELW